ncbi:MAG: hypothetical protein IPH62_19925 [Ignavibacteriae bacterium]|nr:hypothetical protein [Ignavibacteriota bacterium]
MFPQTPEGKNEFGTKLFQANFIDHENTNIVYLSAKRDSFLKLEWETKNGTEWDAQSITKGSSKDNVRPFAVRNAKRIIQFNYYGCKIQNIFIIQIIFHPIKININPTINDAFNSGKILKT